MKTLFKCDDAFICMERLCLACFSTYLFILQIIAYNIIRQDINNIMDRKDKYVFKVAVLQCNEIFFVNFYLEALVIIYAIINNSNAIYAAIRSLRLI